MKIIGLFLLLGVVLCRCQTTTGYVIDGKIENYSGKVFLLSPNKMDKLDTLGEVNVDNGKFRLEGKVERVRFAWLKFEHAKQRIPLFLENTSFIIQVNMEGKSLEWKVSGGNFQQLRVRFKEEVEDKLKEKQDSLEQEYQKCVEENNLFGKYHVRALVANLDTLYERQENKFIQENDNLVSASLLYTRLAVLVKRKMLRGKYELLGDSARNSTLGKILAGYAEKETDMRKSALLPDFSLQTPEDKSVSLHSVKAKVKIVDFWASWCGPCRAENPRVKKLYEKYHDAGLEVISVSLDTRKENWIKAIEQDGLPWIHLSDLQGWESPITKLYGIQGIPYLFVVDENNRIIETRLRGEELDRCVMEAMQ